MRIMRLVVIIWITICLVALGCQGFAGRIPCESGRVITDAAAFLFCIEKETDDAEEKVDESPAQPAEFQPRKWNA